ncbi:MAG: SGNH/GDSL hydrolase family protein [Cocleimonas sp.]|nr:SGNH/GDSL hydrolase family protein [Cocleimonas sp.]
MKKNYLFLLIITLVLPLLSYSDQVVPPSLIKILPLGDSITCASKYKVSYRYPLWKHLVDANKKIEFVGSQFHKGNGGRVGWEPYKGLPFTPANEGHSGWRADQILNGLENGKEKGLSTWLSSYSPDIALIHLGTNDMYQKQTPESTRDEIEQIIIKLRGNNPNIKVILAGVIPMKTDASIARLNQLLAQLSIKLNQPNSPVVSVDMHTGFSLEADMQKDKIHPNANGEKKMAKRWFDALIRHNML